jgi:hypothetical protein
LSGELVARLFQTGDGPSKHSDAGSFLGEAFGDREADAGRRSRYQGDTIGQFTRQLGGLCGGCHDSSPLLAS